MTRGDLATFITPIGIGIGHVMFVFGLMNWIGYPFYLFSGTRVLQIIFLILGLFLVAFVPVLIFARVRLVVPLVMGTIGFGIAIVAELTTPHPEFATLGEDVLIVGTSYIAVYTSGWYVWLLAYGLSGVCEYFIRISADGRVGSVEFSSRHVPFNRKQNVLLGCVVGLAHTAVIVCLGIGREGTLLSGWLLGWGVPGLLLLGSMSMLFLIRYQVISPLAELVSVQLLVGVEALATISGTPVSSYLLFWPVYLALMLLLVMGEHALRLGYRKVTKCRRTVTTTDDRS
ncbi:hypothetical protein [Halegenticoccus tardaugens]|uniref:hypothetical protein n=1 Tax=Halegenticoccus tardaugens TaxID=2071624 RepID=UPI0013E90707|nr:hypothetical protein [Halegenticoccus tardaugens]